MWTAACTATAARAAAGLALPLALALAACFSERDGPAGPAAAECRLRIGPPVFGQPGAVVAIRDFRFQPAEIRVPRGTTVTWVNCEALEAHTATSDARDWGSELLLPGATYSRTFAAPGHYPYHCEPHPSMQATVVVE